MKIKQQKGYFVFFRFMVFSICLISETLFAATPIDIPSLPSPEPPHSAPTSSNPTSAAIESAVVKISATINNYNFNSPWQTPEQISSVGTGFIINDNMIVTNAHVVSNSASIFVQKKGKDKIYSAKVVLIAHDCDLAILTTKEESFFEGITPLSLGEPPEVKQSIFVYGYPSGGTGITITKGIVSRIEEQFYAYNGFKLLAYQIDASVNPGNSGGPVISDNKVIGVVNQQSRAGQNINYIVPVEILQHVLSDIKSGSYKGIGGFPILFVEDLENEALRNYFKLKPNETGTRIAEVPTQSSAHGVLQEDDIILAIDGYIVSNNGNVQIGDLTLSVVYLMTRKKIGENLEIEILRKGERLNVQLPVKMNLWEQYSIEHLTYEKPKYYINGGLVFQPFTLDYFKANKNNFAVQLLYYRALLDSLSKGVYPQFVILTRRLDDDINRGYQQLVYQIIKEVNGHPIRTLEDLVKAFESNTEKDHMIVTDHNGLIILPQDKLKETNQQILEKYSIYRDRNL